MLLFLSEGTINYINNQFFKAYKSTGHVENTITDNGRWGC